MLKRHVIMFRLGQLLSKQFRISRLYALQVLHGRWDVNLQMYTAAGPQAREGLALESIQTVLAWRIARSSLLRIGHGYRRNREHV